MVATITRDELKAKMNRGENFLLVETLSALAYEAQHLPGAINLPPDQVETRASQVLPDKRKEIVVYCSSPT
jgi:rhodanese-related sulfurtransferase